MNPSTGSRCNDLSSSCSTRMALFAAADVPARSVDGPAVDAIITFSIVPVCALSIYNKNEAGRK